MLKLGDLRHLMVVENVHSVEDPIGHGKDRREQPAGYRDNEEGPPHRRAFAPGWPKLLLHERESVDAGETRYMGAEMRPRRDNFGAFAQEVYARVRDDLGDLW